MPPPPTLLLPYPPFPPPPFESDKNCVQVFQLFSINNTKTSHCQLQVLEEELISKHMKTIVEVFLKMFMLILLNVFILCKVGVF